MTFESRTPAGNKRGRSHSGLRPRFVFGCGLLSILVPYKEWDVKPQIVEPQPSAPDGRKSTEFELATLATLSATPSSRATPGEFDLLDARSLMERGDYTGAVRRIVSALEAVVEWALRNEFLKRYPAADVDLRLKKTENDAPGRFRQWRRVTKAQIGEFELDEYEATRSIRHDIVHRARRLEPSERGRAQRSVDTGSWLYAKIAGQARGVGAAKQQVVMSAGRGGIALRFPTSIQDGGLVVQRPPA